MGVVREDWLWHDARTQKLAQLRPCRLLERLRWPPNLLWRLRRRLLMRLGRWEWGELILIHGIGRRWLLWLVWWRWRERRSCHDRRSRGWGWWSSCPSPRWGRGRRLLSSDAGLVVWQPYPANR